MQSKIPQTRDKTQSSTSNDMGEYAPFASGTFRAPKTSVIYSSQGHFACETTRDSKGNKRFAFPKWALQRSWYFWLTPRGIFTSFIGVYRLTLSPYLGNCCRFTPSCSQYALDTLEVHGLLRSFRLIIWRILRCNPFCEGGYDPVPPKH